MHEDLPAMLVELTVVSGHSFRRNLNNRLDNVVALAANVARAFDVPDLASYRPGVAFVFLFDGEDAYSAAETYSEVLRTMVADELITAACCLVVDPAVGIKEPHPDQSFEALIEKIESVISTFGVVAERTALSATSLGRVLSRTPTVEGVVSGLTSTPEGLSAAEAAVIRQRRRAIASLQELAVAPTSTETTMQAAIGNLYWVFGGQYIGVAERRDLMSLDQHDIPLICADGSLQIVELKSPGSRLVRRYRNHFIVANEVHEAVSQCLNYLRAVDELGATMQTYLSNETGVQYDLRRARGTVIIGHPARERNEAITRDSIDQTIRSYNAHLSRIQILTYADLLESAERSLKFEAESPQADSRS